MWILSPLNSEMYKSRFGIELCPQQDREWCTGQILQIENGTTKAPVRARSDVRRTIKCCFDRSGADALEMTFGFLRCPNNNSEFVLRVALRGTEKHARS